MIYNMPLQRYMLLLGYLLFGGYEIGLVTSVRSRLEVIGPKGYRVATEKEFD